MQATHAFLGMLPLCLIGWLVVLRINVDLAVFQPYLDLEAGDNQSLKIQVARPGFEPRSSCSASQELNHSATAAPHYAWSNYGLDKGSESKQDGRSNFIMNLWIDVNFETSWMSVSLFAFLSNFVTLMDRNATLHDGVEHWKDIQQ